MSNATMANMQARLLSAHKCYICKHESFSHIFEYKKPDKYEMSIGISGADDGFTRSWFKCNSCGLYFSSYSLQNENPMDPIYGEVYRDMRGETTKQTFLKINSLPHDRSESRQRVQKIKEEIGQLEASGSIAKRKINNFLDIGGGNGIFAQHFRDGCFIPHVVDPASQGSDLLRELNIDFAQCFYRSRIWGKPFQLITLIYVLEHVLSPRDMLREVVKDLDSSGSFVYIEVPDGISFRKFDKDNDIFNSCHLWLFEPLNLTLLLQDCGLEVMSLYRRRQLRGHYSLHAICSLKG